MIVRPRPGLLPILFTLQGSVVPLIAGRIALVMALSAGVTLLYRLRPGWMPVLPATPFGLLGLGLSIFLGFRNTACYDRWWEARKQWGRLLATARSLSRRIEALGPALFAEPERRERTVLRLLAFGHALRARLRGDDPVAAARPWLDPAALAHLAGRPNPPDAILRLLAVELAEPMRAGRIGEIGFHDLDAQLRALGEVQAACERIRSTPTPFAYTLLLHRTAWLFCLLVPFTLGAASGIAAPLAAGVLAYAFFGLDALGDTLEDPFALGANTLPLDAMLRTLEIELLDGLGRTPLPQPLQPVRRVLT